MMPRSLGVMTAKTKMSSDDFIEVPTSVGPSMKWGSLNGRPIFIDAVKPGDNITCLSCGEKLTPRLGKFMQHHFAHRAGSDCHGETASHKMGKTIVSNHSRLRAPSASRIVRAKKVEVAGRWIPYQRSVLEKKLSGTNYIPDVLIFENGTPICIEIKITHTPEIEKQNCFRDLGIDMLEIDCNGIMALSASEAESFVLSRAPRRWLVCKELDSVVQNVIHERRTIETDSIRRETIRKAKQALMDFRSAPSQAAQLSIRELEMKRKRNRWQTKFSGNPFTVPLEDIWAITWDMCKSGNNLENVFRTLDQRGYIKAYANDVLTIRAVHAATKIDITPMFCLKELLKTPPIH